MDEYEKSAAQLLASIEATYVPTHQYVPADPAQFRHLDLQFYDRALAELQASGYRLAGDVEDLTISYAPHNIMKRVMIRTMLSRDGTVMAAAYDPKLKWIWRILLTILRLKPKPVLDFETEFDDGGFFVTSNAQAAAAMQPPPLICTEYFPAGTPACILQAFHTEGVQAYAALTGASPRTIASHAELVEAQNRMNAIKSAHRNELGGIAREELERATPQWPETARRIHEKVVELRQRAAV
jgi:hypothetical protein